MSRLRPIGKVEKSGMAVWTPGRAVDSIRGLLVTVTASVLSSWIPYCSFDTPYSALSPPFLSFGPLSGIELQTGLVTLVEMEKIDELWKMAALAMEVRASPLLSTPYPKVYTLWNIHLLVAMQGKEMPI